jgi:predicted RNA-binding protein YlqC (UPF0109 family)
VQELLDYVVRALVRDVDAVEVTGDADGLNIQVASDDRGLIIGREGRTIRAIETVLAAAAPDGRCPSLEIPSDR